VCLWLGVAAVAAITACYVLIGWTTSDAHRNEAENAARASGELLAASVGLDLLAARGAVPPKLGSLAETMRAQQIVRIKMYDPVGHQILVTDGQQIERPASDDQPNIMAAAAAASGEPLVRSHTGRFRPGLSPYHATAYVPVWRDAKVAGVLEVFVDQSANAASSRQRAATLSLAIALIVLCALSLPAVSLVLKSRKILVAERTQQTHDARFAATVESIPQGFVMFDRDDKLLACNERYRRMYYLPEHLSVPGTPLADIIRHGVDAGLLSEDIAKSNGYEVRISGPDAVAKHTWDLRDGRIISISASGMAEGGRVSIHADITEQHRTAKQVAVSEARFRDYASSAADWFWETDAEHRIVFVSEAFELATGFDTSLTIGKRLDKSPSHPDDAERIQALAEAMDKRVPFRDFYIRMPGANGKYFAIASNGAPRFASDGTFLGYRGTARDVTSQQANIVRLELAEQELRKRTQLLEEAQRLGKLGNVTYTFGSPQLEWSAEVFSIMRVAPNDGFMPKRYIKERCLDGGAARLNAALRLVADEATTQSVDIKVRCDDGTIVDCAVVVKGLFDDKGKQIGFRSVVQDISERKRAVEQLEQLAFYDQLTGLPNRAMFTRELDALLAGDEWGDAALLLLDLDRFKDVNDSLGHTSGDELLSKVSAMIASRLRSEHLLARIGGDEFAIIMRRSRGQRDAAALAASIIEGVSGSILLSNGEVAIGTSIGIAFPNGESSGLNLFRKADLALYKAKEGGRGCFEFFRQDMDEALQHKMRLERDLKRAVMEDSGLSVHYQAQADLRLGRITGFEALLRWSHPALGNISPAQFIPVAETSHLIIDLGRWVLRKAACQMKAWIDAGHEPREISVNVSAAQLWHSDLVADVTKVLAETGLPPHLLCLELTESLLANPSEQRVRSEIGRLKDLGVKLALDDFGTDYSSLGYLTQLPFDKLKIDRVFVDGVASSDRRRELLKGIVALGHGLGMTVVGEGAEKAEEIEILTQLGCDVAQGYVLARPLPAAQAVAMAASFQPPGRSNAVHALQHRLLNGAG
jgi:diguanylate cyclase (GGDEF)-like protein/PAS domain S-box-containing protein